MSRIAKVSSKRLASPRKAVAGLRAGLEDVFNVAERIPAYCDHLRAHYRRTRRTWVDIPARIKLLITGDAVYDLGSAWIRNVSSSGAFLGEVDLPRQSYPVVPFKLEILLQGDYDGIGLKAAPVRFDPEQRGMGVAFTGVFVTA
jgi:hypothetical protein